jgi:hypothetical protein
MVRNIRIEKSQLYPIKADIFAARLLAPAGQHRSVHKNDARIMFTLFAKYILTNITIEVVYVYFFAYRC